MSNDKKDKRTRDITDDFLLCNRCGTCRAVCPLFTVFREEWASARGKVELAEAYFQGADVPPEKIQEIFDLCLHCMSCEENCPSGMRADEVVMAVRADMARKGMIPRVKRLAASPGAAHSTARRRKARSAVSSPRSAGGGSVSSPCPRGGPSSLSPRSSTRLPISR
jgi:Fe-S oxidoreductase